MKKISTIRIDLRFDPILLRILREEANKRLIPLTSMIHHLCEEGLLNHKDLNSLELEYVNAKTKKYDSDLLEFIGAFECKQAYFLKNLLDHANQDHELLKLHPEALSHIQNKWLLAKQEAVLFGYSGITIKKIDHYIKIFDIQLKITEKKKTTEKK